ncbi:MAG: diguanylate cyclase [Oscillospiraceae bacterium]|nr:diguanylate cyclase [Oscillospiraceae bacterium]
MDPVAEYLFDYLRDIIYDPARAALELSKLPEGFVELGQGLEFFADCVSEMRAFSGALAKGDLTGALPSRDNELAAPLKALHATLKHLTWQTQQVAKGDYRQHVDYLGDFADAFNTMTKQLEQRYAALTEEIERSRQKTQALSQSNDLFEIVTKETAQWIAVVERVSREWLFSNYPVASILADGAFLPQLERWIGDRLSVLDAEEDFRAAVMELTANGLAQYFSVMSRPLTWRERDAVVFVLTDVSAEHEHIKELETAAYRDPLTKQYNRHYGMRLLDQLTREKASFVLCFVDIDNLKYVNDKYGHLEGDKYILHVTAVLRGFSPDIAVCRLGGDEFMLLAQDWSAEKAETRMEALRGRLVERNASPEAFYYHSLSYGVIGVGADNTLSPSELLATADEKMYEYKRFHKMERPRNT